MYYVELLGVGASAIAGAMIAIDKGADIFGVILLGVVTAFGGGITRDMMLGIVPRFFTSYVYVAVAALLALAVFIDAYNRIDHYRANKELMNKAINFVDALAVATYTVSGMNIAIGVEGMDNALLIVSLGVITGVGGGMLRDIMVDTMPFVLKKRVYAVASLTGAIVYYLMLSLALPDLLCSVVSMVLIFTLRILATIFKWNLPRVKL